MTCDRCYQPLEAGDHGLYLCPLEPRHAPTVRPDSIPGGLMIHHGLCNPDGTPKRYDSQSEITRECEARGLTRWTDIHEERSLNGARDHADWLQSGDAKRQRAQRDEARAEKRARQ